MAVIILSLSKVLRMTATLSNTLHFILFFFCNLNRFASRCPLCSQRPLIRLLTRVFEPEALCCGHVRTGSEGFSFCFVAGNPAAAKQLVRFPPEDSPVDWQRSSTQINYYLQSQILFFYSPSESLLSHPQSSLLLKKTPSNCIFFHNSKSICNGKWIPLTITHANDMEEQHFAGDPEARSII